MHRYSCEGPGDLEGNRSGAAATIRWARGAMSAAHSTTVTTTDPLRLLAAIEAIRTNNTKRGVYVTLGAKNRVPIKEAAPSSSPSRGPKPTATSSPVSSGSTASEPTSTFVCSVIDAHLRHRPRSTVTFRADSPSGSLTIANISPTLVSGALVTVRHDEFHVAPPPSPSRLVARRKRSQAQRSARRVQRAKGGHHPAKKGSHPLRLRQRSKHAPDRAWAPVARSAKATVPPKDNVRPIRPPGGKPPGGKPPAGRPPKGTEK